MKLKLKIAYSLTAVVLVAAYCVACTKLLIRQMNEIIGSYNAIDPYRYIDDEKSIFQLLALLADASSDIDDIARQYSLKDDQLITKYDVSRQALRDGISDSTIGPIQMYRIYADFLDANSKLVKALIGANGITSVHQSSISRHTALINLLTEQIDMHKYNARVQEFNEKIKKAPFVFFARIQEITALELFDSYSTEPIEAY